MTLKNHFSCRSGSGSGMDGQKGEKKGFVVCLHLHLYFITCLEVLAELVGTNLPLQTKSKKKLKN